MLVEDIDAAEQPGLPVTAGSLNQVLKLALLGLGWTAMAICVAVLVLCVIVLADEPTSDVLGSSEVLFNSVRAGVAC